MNVIKAYFENDTMVDKFSDTVGMLANVTSFGDESCFNITHDPDGWLSTDEDVRVCTMIGAFVVEYYNGKSTHGASDFLWVSFSFAEDNDDDEKSLLDITGNICDKVTGGPLEVVNFLAGVFFPELAPLAIAGTGVVEVGCEAVDIYNEAKEQDIMVRE